MTRFLEASETAVDTRPPLSDVAEYAYAAITRGGATLIHLAGACPLAADGSTTPIGDVRGQAAVCVANLEQSLAAAGASITDLVKTTVYVASADQADLVAAWEVIRDGLAPHRPPSTLLGVAALGYDDQLVEIEAVAAIGASGP
ncbi:RidA family protein [Bogoriella caseilytica]|uniref:Enamine deaminase RidA (YjgF/YER057c/UK114 family) n=1 Tax=Bogoriella caseilytica TaxID=56055 RepID=A0A3N2BCK1_9MICO|nr:RidA family protein [Bogoriella caseilytica]ROR72981.1 enamine deaminase RidA (YjgF/YER057c/UK114 family) [Bogoriella caseilytica]